MAFQDHERETLRTWLAKEQVQAPKPAKFNVRTYQRSPRPRTW
ncbi:hypothetical protein [Corallococcus exiguus]|nr:hypothetical protein [Corallococcus exiguus]